MQLHFTDPASETVFGLFVFIVVLLAVIATIVVVFNKCLDWVIKKQ